MERDVEILLIEDSESDAELTIRALKKNNLGNKLFHVADGAAALDFFFAEGKYISGQTSKNPHLILLDLKLPKVSGIEVLMKIKGDPRTKKIPVVVFTSSKEDPDVQTCYDLGANGYVVKPVEYDKFYQAITNLGLFWMIVNQPPQKQ